MSEYLNVQAMAKVFAQYRFHIYYQVIIYMLAFVQSLRS